MTATCAQRVTAARTSLVLDDRTAFFGAMALGLKVVIDNDCATAWTDGVAMGFSPAFVDPLTSAELLGLVAHEVAHVALLHPWRRGNRDNAVWNKACDYAVNAILLGARFKLPKGGLFNPDFSGRSAEWIYARLQKDNAEQSDEPGAGTPVPGEVRDAPTNADAPTEADTRQRIQQAALAANGRGELPGAVKDLIKQARASIVDWRSILRRFVSETSKADYTWTRPNMRYMSHGVYLPALHSESMGEVVVVFDTSGSTADPVTRAQFVAELNAVITEMEPARVHVYCADADVYPVAVYDKGETIDGVQTQGGGGTDFRPLFDAVDKLDTPPACVIYLTDLDGPAPDVEPEYPVLWACTRPGQTAPFGELVELDT
jgi:predicted metal-dependent peptidase